MGPISASTIRQNYMSVLERIERAAVQAGRAPESVKLVVVTKTHPAEVVEWVLEAGARFIGENYVEEAIQKMHGLSLQRHAQWHMIGHIQRRKAGLVCQYFQYVHSLDSLRLAQRLSVCALEQNLVLPVLLECNLAGEESKFGFPIWQEETWPDLLPEIVQIVGLPNLQVSGLMGMAPFLPEPEQARPFYRRLRMFREFLRSKITHVEWLELSMGMSGDFEVAVQEGATWVRIGQSILGPRPAHENIEGKGNH